MDFNVHSGVEGKHAFLSPSSYHWINYTDQKLVARYTSHSAARRGTDLHQLACDAIRLGIRLSKATPILSMYVADAIDYQMNVEQSLFYSNNCFGTADAISFRRKTLRIHDLKTGLIPGNFHQLEVYAAIFCLEYGVSPFDIRTELRIYQKPPVDVMDADPEAIFTIMDKIIDLDMKLEFLKDGGEL